MLGLKPPGVKWPDRVSELLVAMATKYSDLDQVDRALRLVAQIPWLRYRVPALVQVQPGFHKANDPGLLALLRPILDTNSTE